MAGFAAPLLRFRVGVGTTTRLMLTGTPLTAIEAERLGLFHLLVPSEKVWAQAAATAEQCGLGAPHAVQLSKRLIYETFGESLASELACGAALAATSRTSPAADEGIAAYLENRLPRWD
ncbi:MAG: enoyl-CoA hydratase/isomerase family protein [Planctomycetales bacterium]|nr:enoyl-CoA hydratase/isomerase family protein [Planctomycetales bacterium]